MSEGMIIVMAGEKLEDHDLMKKAVRECRINHVFTSVFNGSQLMDLLLKRGVYKTDAGVYPDLVIMDTDLPVVKGFQILEKIKELPALKKIPFYIITSDNQEESKLRATEHGAAGYFIKPLRYEEVQGIVRSICREKLKNKNHPQS